MQQGPWSKNGSQIVDTDGNVVMLDGVGLAMRTIPRQPGQRSAGIALQDQDVIDNTNLVEMAPAQNHLIGKILDVFNNPYLTDQLVADELFQMVDQLRNVYIQEENYEAED